MMDIETIAQNETIGRLLVENLRLTEQLRKASASLAALTGHAVPKATKPQAPRRAWRSTARAPK